MERSDSSMSQNSLLSEGTLREVVDCVGDNSIDFLLKDGDLDLFQPRPEMVFPHHTPLQTIPEVSPVPGPSPTCKVPCLNEYPGPYSFQFEIQSESSDRTKWLFSTPLNKLFVNMFTKIPVKFKWIWQEPDLFIRALPVYTNEEYFEQPVLRCPRHSSPREHSNEGFQHLLHIIRSDHDQTEYQEDPESHRRSIVVPVGVPPPGTDYVTVYFTFTCKNSCPVGMNRRSTAIIFTLEQRNGEVVGRQVMQVRICSCPKRDKEKEEADLRGRVQRDLLRNGELELHQSFSEKRSVTHITDRSPEPRFETVTMLWSKKTAAKMAHYAYFLIHRKATKEKRSLTSQEKELVDFYKKVMKTYGTVGGAAAK